MIDASSIRVHRQGAIDLLNALPPGCNLLADRVCDSTAIRAMIAAQGASAIIPSMTQRNPLIPNDRASYKVRNWVERFFNKTNNHRTFTTRCDKRDDNFLASVQLASIRVWLRSHELLS